MVLKKGPCTIKFDIKIPTPEGALYCMYFKRTSDKTTENEKNSPSEFVLSCQDSEINKRISTAKSATKQGAEAGDPKKIVAKIPKTKVTVTSKCKNAIRPGKRQVENFLKLTMLRPRLRTGWQNL